MSNSSNRVFWFALAALLLISRAAHLNILWADEDYHLAVAVQALHGKMLYRDVWYDKPPLNALLMLLIGGWPGWPLRIASVVLELAAAVVAFRFASRLWTAREGYIAAALFVFFHVFYFAYTVMPLEPDTLMVLPHLLAIYWAWSKRPALAGLAAGLAFLLNTKGIFILPACLLFYPAGWLALAAGFAAPCAAMGGWLISQGAFGDYLDQIWRWGFLYAANPQEEPPSGPALRFASWLAFHSALLLGSGFALARIQDRTLRWKLALWAGVSLVAVSVGWRFPPRYLNQLFPPLLILGSAGIAVLLARRTWWQLILLAAIVVPVVRFTPRYVQLLAEDWRGQQHDWRDATMDRESRDGAAIVNKLAKPGDTIFIWGYRPNVVVYTRLAVVGQMWESQPVTGIPADRHLSVEVPLDAAWAAENQAELLLTHPTFIVDGLSAYNIELDIFKYPKMAEWMKPYCDVGKAGRGMTVYRLCDPRVHR
jgi:hypothetical protein